MVKRILAGLALLALALTPAASPAQFNPIAKPDVAGASVVVGCTVTRPADTTAYASGDLVANSTTAGSVAPCTIAAARNGGSGGTIVRMRLSTTHTSLAGADTFRVHLFKNSPTVANGDNGAYSVNGVAAVETSKWDCTLDAIYSDGAKGWCVPSAGNAAVFDTAANSLNVYALIEARGAYTPISGEVFAIALEEWVD